MSNFYKNLLEKYKHYRNHTDGFILYRIVNSEDQTLWFQIDIANLTVAQHYCNYLSKRDNKNYIIQKYLMCIGIPDYKDEEIELSLKEGGYW